MKQRIHMPQNSGSPSMPPLQAPDKAGTGQAGDWRPASALFRFQGRRLKKVLSSAVAACLCLGIGFLPIAASSPENYAEEGFPRSSWNADGSPVSLKTGRIHPILTAGQEDFFSVSYQDSNALYLSSTNVSAAAVSSTAVSSTAVATATVPSAVGSESPVVPPAVPAAAQPVPAALQPITESYTLRHLPADQQQVYRTLLSAVRSGKSYVTFQKPVALKTVTDLYTAIYDEEPDCRYLGLQFGYDQDPVSYFQITYNPGINAAVMQQRYQAMMSFAKAIADQTAGMSDYDKVRAFHDFLIRHVTYTLEGSSMDISSAYGALLNGRALCQGYSQAFSLLCNLAGVDNCYVVGFAKENHMWNKVQINGKWYQTDVTWDDPDFDGPLDTILYDYMNVTDADLASRTVYVPHTVLPQAISLDDNYYVRSGLYAATLDQAKQIVYRAMASAKENGSAYAAFRCASPALYQEVDRALLAEGGLYSLAQQVKQEKGVSVGTHIQYMENPEMNTIQLWFSGTAA